MNIDDARASLIQIVGENNVLIGDDVTNRSVSWGEDIPCQALVIVRPADTNEVAALVKYCAANALKIGVHGGRTGLVGGTQASDETVVISLERMCDVEQVDLNNRTITVGAGVTLERVQNAALENDLFFALDLGARGTATVGGAISTNAGGLNVIRFGMMREQVLGLEVVLANGEIVNSLHSLIKNNAGYDLKQLFIGAEGTLGIVTRATLRLRFLAPQVNTAFLATSSFEDALKLLHTIESQLAGQVSAFEVMWPDFYDRVTAKKSAQSIPLPKGMPMYVIIEALSAGEHDQENFLNALEQAIEKTLVLDAVIANSSRERRNMWELREDIEAVMSGGPTAHFDLGFNCGDIPRYLEQVTQKIKEATPSAIVMPFGHLGDNNLHLSVNIPQGSYEELALIKEIVYQALVGFEASVSAEHGIGTQKKKYLHLSKNAAEISLMKLLKSSLDPHNILNSNLVL